MTSTEKRLDTRSKTTSFFVCLLSLLPFFLWLWSAWPWLLYPYDIDPTDGDILNAGLRISQGFPPFGDWKQGEIFGNYGAGFYLWIASFAKLLPLEVAVGALRVSNVFFLFLAFILGAKTLLETLSTKKQSIQTLAVFIFSASFWMIMGESTISTVTLQSNPMLLLFQASAVFLAVSRKKNMTLVIFVMAALPLVKQSGLACSAALFLCSLYQFKKQRLKFVCLSIASAALIVGGFELWSQGYFLKASFLFPREVFSTPPNWVENHPKTLIAFFFQQQMWLYYSLNTLFFVFAVLSKRHKLLYLFFALELALFFKIGHNIGGGLPYLWFYGFLLCLFVAQLGAQLWSRWSWFPHRLFSRLVLFPIFFVIFIVLAAHGARTLKDSQSYRQQQTQKMLSLVQEESAQKALSFMREHSNEAWFANRFSMPLIQSGTTLDVETCTLLFAMSIPSFVELDSLKERFTKGHYKFLWLSEANGLFEMSGWIKQCYEPVMRQTWPHGMKARDFTIYRYNESCLKEASSP